MCKLFRVYITDICKSHPYKYSKIYFLQINEYFYSLLSGKQVLYLYLKPKINSNNAFIMKKSYIISTELNPIAIVNTTDRDLQASDLFEVVLNAFYVKETVSRWNVVEYNILKGQYLATVYVLDEGVESALCDFDIWAEQIVSYDKQ